MGSEWATHRKVIEIKKEKGGILKQIPKSIIFFILSNKLLDFPYFYIDFDTTYGYAHILEKPKDYDKNFAHVIIIMLC